MIEKTTVIFFLSLAFLVTFGILRAQNLFAKKTIGPLHPIAPLNSNFDKFIISRKLKKMDCKPLQMKYDSVLSSHKSIYKIQFEDDMGKQFKSIATNQLFFKVSLRDTISTN